MSKSSQHTHLVRFSSTTQSRLPLFSYTDGIGAVVGYMGTIIVARITSALVAQDVYDPLWLKF